MVATAQIQTLSVADFLAQNTADTYIVQDTGDAITANMNALTARMARISALNVTTGKILASYAQFNTLKDKVSGAAFAIHDTATAFNSNATITDIAVTNASKVFSVTVDTLSGSIPVTSVENFYGLKDKATGERTLSVTLNATDYTQRLVGDLVKNVKKVSSVGLTSGGNFSVTVAQFQVLKDVMSPALSMALQVIDVAGAFTSKVLEDLAAKKTLISSALTRPDRAGAKPGMITVTVEQFRNLYTLGVDKVFAIRDLADNFSTLASDFTPPANGVLTAAQTDKLSKIASLAPIAAKPRTPVQPITVTVAQFNAMQAVAAGGSFAISDQASAFTQTAVASLVANISKIASITNSSAGTIAVNAAQFNSLQAKFVGENGFAVQDDSQVVKKNLGNLVNNSKKIASITVTGDGVISCNVAQFKILKDKHSGSFAVSDVSSAFTPAVLSDMQNIASRITSLATVKPSARIAAGVITVTAEQFTVLQAKGGNGVFAVRDVTEKFTPEFLDSLNSNMIAKMSSMATIPPAPKMPVGLIAVTVAQFNALQAKGGNGVFAISDSIENLSSNLAGLVKVSSKIASIAVNVLGQRKGLTLNVAQFQALKNKLEANKRFSIADEAKNFTASVFNDIASKSASIVELTLHNFVTGTVISANAAQFLAFQTVSGLGNAYFKVSDVATNFTPAVIASLVENVLQIKSLATVAPRPRAAAGPMTVTIEQFNVLQSKFTGTNGFLINDTEAKVYANLSTTLFANAAKISSIAGAFVNPIKVTAAQFQAFKGKMNMTNGFIVQDVAAAFTSSVIADLASNAGKVSSITVSDTGILTANVSQWNALQNKLVSATTKFALRDSSKAINLTTLARSLGQIASVTVTSGAVNLNMAQFGVFQPVMAGKGGYNLTMTLEEMDSQIDKLGKVAGSLSYLTLNADADTTTDVYGRDTDNAGKTNQRVILNATSTQILSLLGKIKLNLGGVKDSDGILIFKKTQGVFFNVTADATDVTANIAVITSALSGSNASRVLSITVNDKSGSVIATAAQFDKIRHFISSNKEIVIIKDSFANIQKGLGFLTGVHAGEISTIVATDATLATIETLLAGLKGNNFAEAIELQVTIKDSFANILADLSNDASSTMRNLEKITNIQFTDKVPQSLTVNLDQFTKLLPRMSETYTFIINDSVANLTAGLTSETTPTIIARVKNIASLSVRAPVGTGVTVTVDQFNTLQDKLAVGAGAVFAIKDTEEKLTANFDALTPNLGKIVSLATTAAVDADIAMTQAQFVSLANVLGALQVTLVSTASDLRSDLGVLSAKNANIKSITLSNQDPIQVTAEQFNLFRDKITFADTAIKTGAFSLTDRMDNIIRYLASINEDLDKLNRITVDMGGGNPEIDVATVVTLFNHASFKAEIADKMEMVVRDSLENITQNLSVLVAHANDIHRIAYTSANGEKLNVTVAQFVALQSKFPGASRAGLLIRDTAASFTKEVVTQLVGMDLVGMPSIWVTEGDITVTAEQFLALNVRFPRQLFAISDTAENLTSDVLLQLMSKFHLITSLTSDKEIVMGRPELLAFSPKLGSTQYNFTDTAEVIASVLSYSSSQLLSDIINNAKTITISDNTALTVDVAKFNIIKDKISFADSAIKTGTLFIADSLNNIMNNLSDIEGSLDKIAEISITSNNGMISSAEALSLFKNKGFTTDLAAKIILHVADTATSLSLILADLTDHARDINKIIVNGGGVLTVTAEQFSSLQSKFISTGELSIQDSAANLTSAVLTNLSGMDLTHLSSIRVTGGPIAVTVAQFLALSNYSSETGVFAISGAGADFTASVVARLVNKAGTIASIRLSDDNGQITMYQGQYDALRAKFSGSGNAVISGNNSVLPFANNTVVTPPPVVTPPAPTTITLAQLATMITNKSIATASALNIQDSVAAFTAANVTSLVANAGKIASIRVSDDMAIPATVAQMNALLTKVPSTQKFAISDTAGFINLGVLAANISQIASIKVTAGTVVLTTAQLATFKDLITGVGGWSLSITLGDAADSINDLAKIAGSLGALTLNVDTDLTKDIYTSGGKDAADKINNIIFETNNVKILSLPAITLSAALLNAKDASDPPKAIFAVTAYTVPKVTFDISANGTDLSSNMALMTTKVARINSISVNKDSGQVIATVAQFNVVGKFFKDAAGSMTIQDSFANIHALANVAILKGTNSAAISNIIAADVTTANIVTTLANLTADGFSSRVQITLSDSAQNITNDLRSVSSSIIANVSKIAGIKFTDKTAPQLTVTLAQFAQLSTLVTGTGIFAILDSDANFNAETAVASLMKNPKAIASITVQGSVGTGIQVTLEQFNALQGKVAVSAGAVFAINDTAESMTSNALDNLISNLGKVASLTADAEVAMTIRQFGAFNNNNKLGALQVNLIDTAENVRTQIEQSSALLARNTNINSITISDNAVLRVTVNQFTSLKDKVSFADSSIKTGALFIADSLNNIANSLADIGEALDKIVEIGIVTATGSLNGAEALSLLRNAGFTADIAAKTILHIADNSAALTLILPELMKSARNINTLSCQGTSLQLTEEQFETLQSKFTGSGELIIQDSASSLTAAVLTRLAGMDLTHLSSIRVTGEPVTMTVAQFVVLNKYISGTDALVISDTAANFTASSLVGMTAKIAQIKSINVTNNESVTMNHAQYTSLKAKLFGLGHVVISDSVGNNNSVGNYKSNVIALPVGTVLVVAPQPAPVAPVAPVAQPQKLAAQSQGLIAAAAGFGDNQQGVASNLVAPQTQAQGLALAPTVKKS